MAKIYCRLSVKHIRKLGIIVTNHLVFSCIVVSYFSIPQTQKGGQTVGNTNTEQIAALNTELGQLTATSTHLNEKLKQVGVQWLTRQPTSATCYHGNQPLHWLPWQPSTCTALVTTSTDQKF